jgi:hypothetical protein
VGGKVSTLRWVCGLKTHDPEPLYNWPCAMTRKALAVCLEACVSACCACQPYLLEQARSTLQLISKAVPGLMRVLLQYHCYHTGIPLSSSLLLVAAADGTAVGGTPPACARTSAAAANANNDSCSACTIPPAAAASRLTLRALGRQRQVCIQLRVQAEEGDDAHAICCCPLHSCQQPGVVGCAQVCLEPHLHPTSPRRSAPAMVWVHSSLWLHCSVTYQDRPLHWGEERYAMAGYSAYLRQFSLCAM